MTKQEILDKIAKLEKGINSNLVNDQMKPAMRAQLEKLRTQLAELANSEPEPDKDKEVEKKVGDEKKKKIKKPASAKGPAKEPAPKREKKPAPAPNPAPAPAPNPESDSEEGAEKKPATKEEKTEKAKIKKTVTELKACLSTALTLLNGHKANKAPAKRKKVSQVVSDGIVATVKRAIGMELTNEKAAKIKPEQLKKVRDSFRDGLKSLRSALGGIDSENNKFIEDFVKSFNELIDSVEKKQEELKEQK